MPRFVASVRARRGGAILWVRAVLKKQKTVRILDDETYGKLLRGVLCGCGGGVTIDEVRGVHVYDKRRKRAWREACVCVLLGELGMRLGEVCGIWWAEVRLADFGVPDIFITSRIAKGGRPRTVTCTPVTAYVLACQKILQGGRSGLADDDLVVGRTRGVTRISNRGVQKIIERLGYQHLGLRISPHTLRRTFGDRCRRHGDLRMAQIMLGHQRLESTAHYLADDVGERRRLAAVMHRAIVAFDPPGQDLTWWTGEAAAAALEKRSALRTADRQ